MLRGSNLEDQRGCGWCERRPRRTHTGGRRLGVVLILVSLFWYGAVVDWFADDRWQSGIVGPTALMLVGVWLAVRSILKSRESHRR